MGFNEEASLPEEEPQLPEERAPEIRAGVIIYQRTDGKFGLQDMYEAGGSLEECSLADKAALLSAARDMNLANITAQYVIHQQREQFLSSLPKPGDLVDKDGHKL